MGLSDKLFFQYQIAHQVIVTKSQGVEVDSYKNGLAFNKEHYILFWFFSYLLFQENELFQLLTHLCYRTIETRASTTENQVSVPQTPLEQAKDCLQFFPKHTFFFIQNAVTLQLLHYPPEIQTKFLQFLKQDASTYLYQDLTQSMYFTEAFVAFVSMFFSTVPPDSDVERYSSSYSRTHTPSL